MTFTATSTIIDLPYGSSYIETGKQIKMKWTLPMSPKSISIYRNKDRVEIGSPIKLMVEKSGEESDASGGQTLRRIFNSSAILAGRENISLTGPVLEFKISGVQLSDSATYSVICEDDSGKVSNDSNVYTLEVYGESLVNCLKRSKCLGKRRLISMDVISMSLFSDKIE